MRPPAANSELLESERRLIGIDEVLRLHPMSKSKLYRLMDAGKFPKQARKEEGTTSALWFLDEVLAHIEALRTAPAPEPKLLVADTLIGQQLPAVIQNYRQEPAPSTRAQSKPYLLQARPDTGDPRASLVIQQLTSGAQAIYLEPATGRLFAVVGWMPAPQTDPVSKAIAAPTRRRKKGVRS